MDVTSENQLMQFLRTRRAVFKVKDVLADFKGKGISEAESDVAAFLNCCPLVFALDGGLYMSRAGAFTRAPFSIRPTKKEIRDGYLVPGHRCVPFVDSDVYSGTIDFVYNDRVLPRKVVEFPLHDALGFFELFGGEYAAQYILNDPAMGLSGAMNLEELPSRIKLTVTDFSELYRESGFLYGDTLLSYVEDWDNSVVVVQPLRSMRNTPFEQLPSDRKLAKWYSVLEDGLLESFSRYGPGLSIEDQLAKVFYVFHNKLCVQDCGTTEQLLRQSKRIGLESYGVETRLWFKGHDVPAVGAWMRTKGSAPETETHYGLVSGSPESFPLLQSVLDSWVLDQLYHKKQDEELPVDTLLPDGCVLTEDEAARIRGEILRRKKELGKTYNWFADFEFGELRHRTLRLYSRVSALVYELDCMKSGLEELPQQSLVILTQLLGHSRFMLEVLLGGGADSDEMANFEASIEGMEYNFDDVSAELMDAMLAQRKKNFSIVRNK